MIFQQFVLESLGHASYLLASEKTGEALVLDVRRDVEVYFQAARRHEVRIAYAVDTHQHNDYVTGICELPGRSDIQLLAGARAELAYPTRRLQDGNRIEMGEVLIEVLQTPGHTPEHISLLVTDRARGEDPALLLSGGALLVGDVARPDLLAVTTIRTTWRARCGKRSRTRFSPSRTTSRSTPPTWPARCAAARSAAATPRPSATSGASIASCPASPRRSVSSRSAWTSTVSPPRPPHWRRIRGLNQQGPPLLGVLAEPRALRVDARPPP